MHLLELFQEPIDTGQDITHTIIDILTPFAAQKMPFVTVQQIIDKLREFRTGIHIDRGFIMDLLDPNHVKIVQKIEGDRVYLNTGGAPDQTSTEQDQEKARKHVHKTAVDQAKKAVSNKPQDGAGKGMGPI